MKYPSIDRSDIKLASVSDYQSGREVGREEINWTAYRLWAAGPSEVCEASHCLTDAQIERFGIRRDTAIFAYEIQPRMTAADHNAFPRGRWTGGAL